MRVVSLPKLFHRAFHRAPRKQVTQAPAFTWAAPRAHRPAAGIRPELPPPGPPAHVGYTPAKPSLSAIALWEALHIEDSLRVAVRQGLTANGFPETKVSALMNGLAANVRRFKFAHEGAQVLMRMFTTYELQAMRVAVAGQLDALRTALPSAVARATQLAQIADSELPRPSTRQEVKRYARIASLVDAFASPAGFGPLLPNNAVVLALYEALDDAVVIRATEFYDSPLGSAYINRLIPGINSWCAQFLERVEVSMMPGPLGCSATESEAVADE